MSSITLLGDTSGSIVIDAPAIAGSNTITLPTTGGTIRTTRTPGAVLQVVSTTKTDQYSGTSTSGSWVGNVTGLTASITPSSASNRIFVFGFVTLSVGSTSYPITGSIRVMRDSTSILGGSLGISTSAGPAQDPGVGRAAIPFSFYDTPNTTSSITYGIQIRQNFSSGGITVYVNASQDTTTSGASTITVMEIAG
jgi:hypothetical protein